MKGTQSRLTLTSDTRKFSMRAALLALQFNELLGVACKTTYR
ncbi:MAG: hypothetical protein QOG23_4460 [Blastocatellia bacterium]|jgi:hypothetical protein|nr:hypothetical protein [Blastocatellia bacterium]